MIVTSAPVAVNVLDIAISPAVIDRLVPPVVMVVPERVTVPVLFIVTLVKVVVPLEEKVKFPAPVNSEVVANVRVPPAKFTVAPLDTA